MNIAALSPPPRRRLPRLFRSPLRWRLLTWILIAFVFTSSIVQYSMRDGRLTLPPAFDDIGYMADGAMRLCNFYQNGALPAFEGYVTAPPHSPYSTLLAVMAFIVFGIRDWAPYAANGLVILAYLAFADYVLRGLRTWQKLLAIVVLLSVPMSAMAVNEFRPDHMSALLTVMGAYLILERPFLTASRRRLFAIGAIFALALLTKTPTFPATLAMMFGTMFLGVVADLIIAAGFKTTKPRHGLIARLRPRQVLRSVGICVGAAMLASPHYIIAHSGIYAYIYDNVFGYRKDIWKTGGSLAFQLMYYIDPDPYNGGGGLMLGRHVFLIAAMFVVSVVLTVIRPARKTGVRAAALSLFLAGTYFVVTVNPQKTIFFGLTFQTAAVFLMLAVFRQILLVQRFRTPRIPWATALLVAAVVVGVGEARWPRRNGRYNDAPTTARRDIALGIYKTLLDAGPTDAGFVDIDGTGDINVPLFEYYNARDQHSFDFYSPNDSDDIRLHLEALSSAKFLVLSEPDTQLTADFLLGYRVLPALNAEIRKRPEWQQLGYFVFPPSGKGFHVYENKGLFVGYTHESGLGPIEGPYPQWNMPRVHWGVGPATHFTFTAPDAPVDLVMQFRDEWQDETIQIRLDDRLIYKHLLPGSVDFQTLRFPLDVQAGSTHHVTISYSRWDNTPEMRRSILFRELAILPRANTP